MQKYHVDHLFINDREKLYIFTILKIFFCKFENFSTLVDRENTYSYQYLEKVKQVRAKVSQSWPTLCNRMARILGWVAFPFPRRSSQPRDQTQVSHIPGGFFLV